MNRRGFLRGLGALAATALVPLPRSARVNPVCAALRDPQLPHLTVLVREQLVGCSLTRATITPLTLEMFEELAATEIEVATLLRPKLDELGRNLGRAIADEQARRFLS